MILYKEFKGTNDVDKQCSDWSNKMKDHINILDTKYVPIVMPETRTNLPTLWTCILITYEDTKY